MHDDTHATRLILKVAPLGLKVAEEKVGDHLHILNILELDPQEPSNCRHRSNWPANEDVNIFCNLQTTC